MPETLISSLLPMDFGLRRAARRGRAERSTPRAQVNPAPPPPQGAPPVNPMCPRLEAQLATIDRGGSGDPAKDEQIRRYQDAAGQAAGRTRSRHLAGQAHGLRQFRIFLAVHRPVGAMRSGQQPDSADAGQSRSDHHQPRAAARRRFRRRRSRQSAPLGADGAGAEQLRTAICQCRARRPGNFLDNLFGNNNPGPPRRPISVRNPAPTAPSASAPATAPISRSRSPPCPPASPTTRRPARRSARRRRRPCSPIAIPART